LLAPPTFVAKYKIAPLPIGTHIGEYSLGEVPFTYPIYPSKGLLASLPCDKLPKLRGFPLVGGAVREGLEEEKANVEKVVLFVSTVNSAYSHSVFQGDFNWYSPVAPPIVKIPPGSYCCDCREYKIS
jgi:hypothetical protein